MKDIPDFSPMQVSRTTNFHGMEYPAHLDGSIYMKTCGFSAVFPVMPIGMNSRMVIICMWFSPAKAS